MIRNLKALGLAVCAVFVFGAPSTSAADDQLTSSVSDTFVTGTQVGGEGSIFGTKSDPNAVLECTSNTYSGTFSGTSVPGIAVTPSYTGCKFVALNASVDDEGCKFALNGETEAYTNTTGQANGNDATFSLDCADTGRFRITGPLGCIIVIQETHPANTLVNLGLLGVKYDNEVSNGKWDVRVTITVDGIAYTSNGACQTFGFTATDDDGFLTQTITLKGYSDAAHTNQVNLTVT